MCKFVENIKGLIEKLADKLKQVEFNYVTKPASAQKARQQQ